MILGGFNNKDGTRVTLGGPSTGELGGAGGTKDLSISLKFSMGEFGGGGGMKGVR